MSFLNKSNTAQRIAVPAPPRSWRNARWPISTTSIPPGSTTRTPTSARRLPGSPTSLMKTRARVASRSGGVL